MIFNPWIRGHSLETKANKTYTKYPEQTINFFFYEDYDSEESESAVL